MGARGLEWQNRTGSTESLKFLPVYTGIVYLQEEFHPVNQIPVYKHQTDHITIGRLCLCTQSFLTDTWIYKLICCLHRPSKTNLQQPQVMNKYKVAEKLLKVQW